MGAEVRDPKRSLPRAAWVSSLVATLFYAGATAAVLVLLRPDQVSELNGLAQAGTAAASALGAQWLAPVVSLLVFASAVGQFGGLGSSVSRMPFAAGVDGLLPPAFGKIHPRWNTPHVSILTLGLLASALLIVMQIGDTVRAAYDSGPPLERGVGLGRHSARDTLRVRPARRHHARLDLRRKTRDRHIGGDRFRLGYLLAAMRKAADNSSNVMSPG